MKTLIKNFLNVLAAILAAPLVIYARLGLALGTEIPYGTAAQCMALIPGYFGRYIRRAFYCLVLPECPWDFDMHFGSVITQPTARIGARVWVGLYCILGTCILGDDTLLASRVSILSGRRQHGTGTDEAINQQEGVFECVSIGAQSWIGEGSVIMADVGQASVIGAGSVVVKPIGEMAIAAGNPAKKIKDRGQETPA